MEETVVYEIFCFMRWVQVDEESYWKWSGKRRKRVVITEEPYEDEGDQHEA